MIAVRFANGSLSIDTEVPRPDPASGEIGLRLLLAGICETDMQIVQGYMGFQGTLGHEFVAIAESGSYQGERVVGEINCPCNVCDGCRAGMGNHCPHRSVLGIWNRNGAFAEWFTLPEQNLHVVPDRISDEQAVFTEPLAAAFQIAEQVELAKHRHVAVIGDGRLGYLCAQVLKLYGCDVLVVGKHASKLARFEKLGISTCMMSETLVRDRTLVVECTGSLTGVPTALRCLRPRGTLVQKTTVSGEIGPSLAPLVIDEITLIGSRCGPFAPAIDALANRSIEVDSLITSRFRLDQAIDAFAAAQRSDQMKVLLEI